MALHAAEHHGVEVVGVTISPRQVEAASERVKDAGLAGQVDIRFQDYRDVDDGPFDAISSVGMFEHVGRKRLAEYFGHLHDLLRPEGRLLNHGICRPPTARDARPVPLPEAPWHRRTFVNRYVFPDGELHELGTVVSAMQQQNLEVRHSETLREHYGLTLRGVGRQPGGPVGRGRPVGRAGPGAGVAPGQRRLRRRLRRGSHSDPPGAGVPIR